MILDTSAVIAVLCNEPEAEFCAKSLEQANTRRISAANFLEAAIVFDFSQDPIVSRRFDEFVKVAELIVEPVTAEQAQIAREAYRDFGKGRGHPAQLNFGDCFAYALAKTRNEPLLCIGDDFSRTDITVVQR